MSRRDYYRNYKRNLPPEKKDKVIERVRSWRAQNPQKYYSYSYDKTHRKIMDAVRYLAKKEGRPVYCVMQQFKLPEDLVEKYKRWGR